VADEYGRRYGQRLEAKFFIPARTGTAEAKRLFQVWEADVAGRIAAIRAEQRGEGTALTPQRARALAGEWYSWFVAKHPVSDRLKWEDVRDRVQEALQDAADECEWVRSGPDDAPEELKRGAPKVAKQQENIERAEGFGATAAGQAIVEKWLPRLIESIEGALTAGTRSPLYIKFLSVIHGLPSDVLALSILQTALDSIAQNETKVRSAALSIADAIAGECWMRDLIEDRPDLVKREL
jgi:hypothetical protein